MILWHKLTPRGTRNTIKKYGSARAHTCRADWLAGWLAGWLVAWLDVSWILGLAKRMWQVNGLWKIQDMHFTAACTSCGRRGAGGASVELLMQLILFSPGSQLILCRQNDFLS